jgi:hypothetical protein
LLHTQRIPDRAYKKSFDPNQTKTASLDVPSGAIPLDVFGVISEVLLRPSEKASVKTGFLLHAALPLEPVLVGVLMIKILTIIVRWFSNYE